MKYLESKILNTKGKKCPMPVLLAKKMLKTMNSGETLQLISDDIGAKKDIPALLNKTGDELIELREEESNLIFIIKKT